MKNVKGTKKRWKRRPQRATAVIGRNDDDNSKQAGSSDMERITIAGHSVNQHMLPPTDHFERLLEEAYPNHAYPHQAQAQGLRHDELYGLGVPYLGHGTRGRLRRKRHDAIPRGRCGHEGLRWAPPSEEASHVQPESRDPNLL
jgi:hypothetical protein